MRPSPWAVFNLCAMEAMKAGAGGVARFGIELIGAVATGNANRQETPGKGDNAEWRLDKA